MTDRLNIAEAEERARKSWNAGLEVTADLVSVIALYREAVEALEKWTAHLEYVSPEIVLVLSKARAAGLGDKPECDCGPSGHRYSDCPAYDHSDREKEQPKPNIECAGGHDGMGCGPECP